MSSSKYIPLVYSKKISNKKAHIFIMQHEFIPCELRHTKISMYKCGEVGLSKIKMLVVNNDKYLERYDKPIILQSNIQKPLLNEDWNNYALQRLADNNILYYENVVIVYDTAFKDIITVRL